MTGDDDLEPDRHGHPVRPVRDTPSVLLTQDERRRFDEMVEPLMRSRLQRIAGSRSACFGLALAGMCVAILTLGVFTGPGGVLVPFGGFNAAVIGVTGLTRTANGQQWRTRGTALLGLGRS